MVEVSIIIPSWNEKDHIGKCLDSLIRMDYPKTKTEILVVDGGSTDGTRDIVGEYAKNYPFIKCLDNPRRYTVFAFNIGVKNAAKSSRFITILNAHGSYSEDRIRRAVDNINKYDVDAVGGISRATSRNDSSLGKAISLVLSSPFGCGSSFRREVKEPRLSDTASGCLYRKEVFDKIGLFNENLICSQDMEFNQRLRKAQGKIMLCPDLITHYHARSDLKSFLKHNFRNGLWAILPFKYSTVMPVSLRHLVPCIFVLSLLLSLCTASFSSIFFWVLMLTLISYTLASIYFSIKIATRTKGPHRLLVPAVFALLHFTYGIGSIYGLAKVLPSKRFLNTLFPSRKEPVRREGSFS